MDAKCVADHIPASFYEWTPSHSPTFSLQFLEPELQSSNFIVEQLIKQRDCWRVTNDQVSRRDSERLDQRLLTKRPKTVHADRRFVHLHQPRRTDEVLLATDGLLPTCFLRPSEPRSQYPLNKQSVTVCLDSGIRSSNLLLIRRVHADRRPQESEQVTFFIVNRNTGKRHAAFSFCVR